MTGRPAAAPSDIWGAEMSRGTFRRFVRRMLRATHAQPHQARAGEAGPRRESAAPSRTCLAAGAAGGGSGALASYAGEGQDGSSGIPQSALEEFRVLREFPTLLKIASTHSSVFRPPDKRTAAKHTIVDTSKFAPTSRGKAPRHPRNASQNKNSAAPVICIDTISAIPNTNDSGARVAVRYGNVVRIRSQRSYLQGGVPAQSSVLLSTSKSALSSPSQPLGTVTSAPRVVRDIGPNVPSAVAAAAAAAENMANSDVEEGFVWQIEPMTQFPPGIPSSMSASGSSFYSGTSDRTPTKLANDLSNDSVKFGQAFRLVLVVPPETVENSDSEAEARDGQTPADTRAPPRYVLCATLDSTSLLSRPASSASGSSSRPSSRAARRKDTIDRMKNKKKKKKGGKSGADPGAVRMAQVFVCAENDPRCTVESCAWCFSGARQGKSSWLRGRYGYRACCGRDTQIMNLRLTVVTRTLKCWRMPRCLVRRRYCTAQTPVQDTCHWLLTIVALGWQVVVFQRHAVRCSTGLSSLWMTRSSWQKDYPCLCPPAILLRLNRDNVRAKRRRERGRSAGGLRQSLYPPRNRRILKKQMR